MKKDGKSIDELKGSSLETDKVKGGFNQVNLDEMGGELKVEDPHDVVAKKKGYVREKGGGLQ